MNPPRKTFSVAQILWTANYFFKHSKPEQTGERRGTTALLDTVLHASGNYAGFGYLELTQENGIIKTGDETRVYFYVSNTLSEEYKAIEKRKSEEGF